MSMPDSLQLLMGCSGVTTFDRYSIGEVTLLRQHRYRFGLAHWGGSSSSGDGRKGEIHLVCPLFRWLYISRLKATCI